MKPRGGGHGELLSRLLELGLVAQQCHVDDFVANAGSGWSALTALLRSSGLYVSGALDSAFSKKLLGTAVENGHMELVRYMVLNGIVSSGFMDGG